MFQTFTPFDRTSGLFEAIILIGDDAGCEHLGMFGERWQAQAAIDLWLTTSGA